MSLTIPLPFSARRTRHQAYDLEREAAMPLVEELPDAILVRDIGEERTVRDAWIQCGRQVLRALNNKGLPSYVDNEYARMNSALIAMSTRSPNVPFNPYEVTARPAIMAMARFSIEPPYENPLVDMDRQLAAAMLKEQYPQLFSDVHVTM